MSNQPGLYRQNAMTLYQEIYTFCILASEISTDPNIIAGNPLFYLLFTKEDWWVKVDITTGENIINIIKKKQDPSWADMMDESEMDS